MSMFWDAVIHPLEINTNNNIFSMVAGKSAALTHLGREWSGTSNSAPGIGAHIMLDMLDLKFVVQIMEESIVGTNNLTMKSFLKHFCNIEEHFEYFCKVVYEYSDGIPRLIIYVIYCLVIKYKGNNFDIGSRENIDTIFKNFNSSEMFSELRSLLS